MSGEAPSAAEVAAQAAIDRPVTVADRLISVCLWVIGLAWMIPVMASMMVAAIFVPSDRTDWLNRLYCWGQIRLTGARYVTEVHPDVDPDQVYVFCQNHVNLLDHVTMYNATPHFKQGLELASHFDIPVYGWFMKQRGTIAVHKGRRDAFDLLREGFDKELQLGHSILAFPEGTRSRTGRVGKFRKGVFMAAVELGVPVVPVSVTGMSEILRPGSKVFRPGRVVTVTIHEPIPTEGMGPRDVAKLARQVQAVVAERVDRYWESKGASA